MMSKIFISFLFVTLVIAERDHTPCQGRQGVHFGRNTRGCSWFFQCNEFNEIVTENRCPAGLYFNYEAQNCGPRDAIDCNLDDIDLTCPEGPVFKVIPHPYSCSKYTVCFDGIENDRDCDPGLHFSSYENKCIDPFFADCNLDYILCKKSIETGEPTFIANSRDCRSFYVCVGDTAVPLRCAPGTHFDPVDRWCIAPEEANCTQSIPEDRPTIPDKISIDCEGQAGVMLPHPDSCDFFFFCAGDRSFMQMCGEGLSFDIISSRCQSSETAVCSNTTPIPTLPTIPTTVPTLPTNVPTLPTIPTEETTDDTTDYTNDPFESTLLDFIDSNEQNE